MKTFFAGVLAASACALDASEYEFMQYLSKFGKMYDTVEEFLMRKEVYLQKDIEIKGHNSRPSNFTLGHNKFSDWRAEEMQVMLGEKESLESSNAYCKEPDESFLNAKVPDSVNWVEAGMTTPVKDQGACGSCWTFATTGTVEAANAIFGSGLVSLSEQQLVDCVTVDDGCNGGMTYDAYTYLMSANAYLEKDWAYTAKDGVCHYKASKASDITLSTYVCVQPQTPAAMKVAVAQQPVAISVDAGSTVFHNYTGGVLDSTACGINTNHAISIVGYGTDEDSGLEYWLVRNSWGPDWGVDGYIKIAITEGDGICAINHRPLYPTVA